jgi:hypothetical protein
MTNIDEDTISVAKAMHMMLEIRGIEYHEQLRVLALLTSFLLSQTVDHKLATRLWVQAMASMVRGSEEEEAYNGPLN